MSRQPSAALRALERAIALMPTNEEVTWGQLHAKVAEAARDAEYVEWEDHMGDDL